MVPRATVHSAGLTRLFPERMAVFRAGRAGTSVLGDVILQVLRRLVLDELQQQAEPRDLNGIGIDIDPANMLPEGCGVFPRRSAANARHLIS